VNQRLVGKIGALSWSGMACYAPKWRSILVRKKWYVIWEGSVVNFWTKFAVLETVRVLNPQQLFGLIQDQVNQVFPEFGKAAQDEMAGNLKLVITSVITKLDLVSRDEFDAQQAVLERTRMMLEKLEKTVAELEEKVSD
jgi:BMFP domain-containing protein YqiC